MWWIVATDGNGYLVYDKPGSSDWISARCFFVKGNALGPKVLLSTKQIVSWRKANETEKALRCAV